MNDTNRDEYILNRMVNDNYYDSGGKITFRFYGDFEEINKVHEDCKEELIYVGTSRIDASPVFSYDYTKLDKSDIIDINKLKICLRKFKVKKFANKELTSTEISLISFFEFLMRNYENNLVRNVSEHDIKYYIP